MENEFMPELALEPEEVANLASLRGHPGFPVLQKMLRSLVDKYAVAMINVAETDEKEVLAKHKMAKLAAQYYVSFVNSINNVTELYIATRPQTKPVESAEGIDLGEFTLDTEESLI
jgi:hypothetical protein